MTIVAINPAKHFRDTRNSERQTHISEILNAVTQYTTQEGAVLSDLDIPECDDGAVDVQDLLVGDEDEGMNKLVPTYIVEIPEDPQEKPYTICESDGGRVLITATTETEDGEEEITVTR